ncbi:hypothetical protein ElyMa_001219700, partial [Elysia marginata]
VDARLPRLANWVKLKRALSSEHFLSPSPCGAGSALPGKGCLVNQDAVGRCRRLQVDNRATKVLSRLHAGWRLRLPVTSSTCRCSPLPIAAGL